ncbi:MAG: hypothetical protein BWK79_10285 [Beggiatoa sp. IS2]|nr:MAG: hypothetical protein BWK79_10285 [Beggiatoa sp. IS2]
METQQIKELILKELPALIRQDSTLREWVLNISRTQFADKTETENRFDQMIRSINQKIEEDRQLREEQARKWDENQRKWEENQRKWEENQRKWEENQKVINEMLASIRKLDKKYDQTIGALGTRWGLHSEDAFRNALSGILREFPSGVEVVHVNEFDDAGEVFGRPDQVELDLIIRNGTLLIAEIKSSISRGEMYLFERKARFYERKHQRTAHKLIVISPMVDKRAKEVANKLGVTVYSYTDEVEFA